MCCAADAVDSAIRMLKAPCAKRSSLGKIAETLRSFSKCVSMLGTRTIVRFLQCVKQEKSRSKRSMTVALPCVGRGNYQSSVYQWKGQRCQTDLFPVAVQQFFQPQHLVLGITAGAQQKYRKELKTNLRFPEWITLWSKVPNLRNEIAHIGMGKRDFYPRRLRRWQQLLDEVLERTTAVDRAVVGRSKRR